MSQSTTSDDDQENPPSRYLSLLNFSDTRGPEHAAALSKAPKFDLTQSPLFSWSVKKAWLAGYPLPQQYAVLCSKTLNSADDHKVQNADPIFLNIDAPWSAFVCGSQGAGKSHTLSCILEGCLLASPTLGKLQFAPSALLFHYDTHLSETPCEAAHLSSAIPTTVLVSPSNFSQRRKIYEALNPAIKVRPLLFQDQHMSISRMQRLMAFREGDGTVPLYMEIITNLLRKMAIENQDRRGLNYTAFLDRLKQIDGLSSMQKGPLQMRINLLESFMAQNYAFRKMFNLSEKSRKEDPFTTSAGTLTIVDLSDALVDPSAACSLFDMCLALFFESSTSHSRVIGLDEAHKYLTQTDSSETLTGSILQVIREQRHKGARVVISTQEPTVSPKLLDLCSMTFIHRFSSPAWLNFLRQHIAGLSDGVSMAEITRLGVGESLVFAPLASIDVEEGRPKLMGARGVHVTLRKRLTSDGGQSVLASAGSASRILAPRFLEGE